MEGFPVDMTEDDVSGSLPCTRPGFRVQVADHGWCNIDLG